jgi:hypothetical protein
VIEPRPPPTPAGGVHSVGAVAARRRSLTSSRHCSLAGALWTDQGEPAAARL